MLNTEYCLVLHVIFESKCAMFVCKKFTNYKLDLHFVIVFVHLANKNIIIVEPTVFSAYLYYILYTKLL